MEHVSVKTRKIPKDIELSKDEVEQEYDWVEAAGGNDHLRMRLQINFSTDYIPLVHTSDDFWNKLTAETPRLENPKPSMAFGIYEATETRKQAPR